MMGIRLQNALRIGIFFSGPRHGANEADRRPHVPFLPISSIK
ncbi:hypothetical protein BDE02_11G003700 [Populus trichocarpa]|nr:hypothetical protein BDE02_11G003700 [Populus trichocarpa]